MNALVTGASKGIGKAIAQQLAANNYNLVLCARNLSDLEIFSAELGAQFPQIKIHTIVTDCEKQEEVKALADCVNQYVPIVDVLINNVGLYIPINLLDEEEDTLGRQMQVNVYAAHYLSAFFGKKMRELKRGHIFNICSIAGIQPFVNSGSYCVSKYALLGLTKVLREELMEHHVRVTAVLPGATLTNSWSGTDLPKDRFVAPEDVASAVINCLRMTEGANVDEILIRPLKGNI